jgi:hypothetical protein
VLGNLPLVGKFPHLSLYKLSQKYGDVMEFKLGSISIVVISSPNQMKEVLQIHDPLFATRPKSVILDMFTYGWKDVIWASYGDDWCQNVKVMCIRILQYIGYKLPRKFEMKNCSCALHEIFEHCKV